MIEQAGFSDRCVHKLDREVKLTQGFGMSIQMEESAIQWCGGWGRKIAGRGINVELLCSEVINAVLVIDDIT